MKKALLSKAKLGILVLSLTMVLSSFFTQTFAAEGDIIGAVKAPEAVARINAASGGEIGALFFLSRLIRFGAIVAGIFSMWNFVSAGFTYITGAGNTATHVVVRDKMTWSLVGIIVIVVAYTVAGIIGLVFFKDATYLLNPTIGGVFGP